MSIANAVFQGIVQGLTEFLPVSSSGHLSLIQYFTGQGAENGLLFTVLLHMGTLLSVLIAFRRLIAELAVELVFMIGDIFRGRFSLRHANPNRRLLLLLAVSLLPMAFSLLLLDLFEYLATDGDIIIEGACFLFTSFLLFISDRCNGRVTAANMKYRSAVSVGFMQAIAPLPGISRSGSTISKGLLLGLDREYAVSFSFLMGVPTVLGANLLELRQAASEGIAIPFATLAVGMLFALIFGLFAIKAVKLLVNARKFRYFAWYTLILGALTVAAGIYERISGNALRHMIMSAFL